MYVRTSFNVFVLRLLVVISGDLSFLNFSLNFLDNDLLMDILFLSLWFIPDMSVSAAIWVIPSISDIPSSIESP